MLYIRDKYKLSDLHDTLQHLICVDARSSLTDARFGCEDTQCSACPLAAGVDVSAEVILDILKGDWNGST